MLLYHPHPYRVCSNMDASRFPTEKEVNGGSRIDSAPSSLHDDVMRTIVDLPETQVKALDSYRKREGISRAEAVRRAVEAFVPTRGKGGLDFANHPAFGSSKRYRKEDSVKTVRRLREEWR
jgi:hypothetical protein